YNASHGSTPVGVLKVLKVAMRHSLGHFLTGGYPEVTITNAKLIFAEARALDENATMSERERAKRLEAFIKTNPIAMPTGEAYSDSAVAWSWVGAVTGGVVLIVWGSQNHRSRAIFIGIGLITGFTIVAQTQPQAHDYRP